LPPSFEIIPSLNQNFSLLSDQSRSIFLLFLPSSLCFGKRPATNTYIFVPGNLTRAVKTTRMNYPFTQFSDLIFPDRPNITTFSASYNDIEMLVTVTSNTTGNATFGNLTFTFEFTPEEESISVAEIDVSDRSHISLSTDGQLSLEFSIFPTDGSGEVKSFGFFKPAVDNTSW
jgi:hypothetical protein